VKGQKRRAQDAAEQESRPSKQAKGGQEINEQSTWQLLKEQPPTTTPTISPYTSADSFLPLLTEMADPYTVPERATSPPDSHRPTPLGVNALFSQYVRSRSASFSSKADSSSNIGSIHPHTSAPCESELPIEVNPLLARSVNDLANQLNDCPSEVLKTGVSLRLRQPKPQPRIMLRLSRPKKGVARNSARCGRTSN